MRKESDGDWISRRSAANLVTCEHGAEITRPISSGAASFIESGLLRARVHDLGNDLKLR
jgi:hypothetical protein